MWITSFFQYSFLLTFSEAIVLKVKVAYLKSILEQDIAWFDSINPSELSSKINRETLAIGRALGEKMGMITLSMFMLFTGFFLAFFDGWKYCLTLLVLFPVISIGTYIFTKFATDAVIITMKAFSQSSGYANQALNAIKVVAAFGQEEKEHELFSKFLGRARKAGIK